MIALFGGTFDPVHLGHINMAKHCVKHFNLATLYFMPCAIPAHKTAPGISTQHRIAMLNAAIAPYQYFQLDLRELNRSGPSYSLLSLQEIRTQFPDQPLLFLIGMDSFNNLDKWFEWQTITQLCHIVVFQRPGLKCTAHGELLAYQQAAECSNSAELTTQAGGKLYFLAGEEMAIASSDIRKAIKNAIDYNELLPTSVSQYIQSQQLYLSDE
ncbi:MAG: nicotinate-nucleotide adenylyltransferase [Pseudoalteromonas rhizosphaerae]|jgi:nicotinate-nucleotide adenylyltransferase|uniref:Probable nicotinate-nucleotide adenylyltransferase n=1 Tax=Pseudoalteromonas neustonica TaxID=1840331 RepID=A0ABY3FA82_9GAMM|nr:nicotinate-nucleotide adenylyltransferase [Pseudoalteromonas neustonica]TVU81417.1 nicotinate-nucleotide adenylyltransferase [Pseudoalteromonas neustonica]